MAVCATQLRPAAQSSGRAPGPQRVTEHVCGGGCAATPRASLNASCTTQSSEAVTAALRVMQTPVTEDPCNANWLPVPPPAAATTAVERKQLRPTGHAPALRGQTLMITTSQDREIE